MKKIFLLILGIFLLTSILAVQQTIVETDIALKYSSSGCVTSCVNQTMSNITTQFCNQSCVGILRVEGENVLKEFSIGDESWTEIVENHVIRELGNETDITGLLSRLDECLTATDKLNDCMDSNRNVSVQLMMVEEDIGYKSNYTECKSQKDSIQNQLGTKNSIIADKDAEIEKSKANNYWWGAGGILACYLFITKVRPWHKGRETPKDEVSEKMPANPPY